jgi:hypothetical protein
MRTNYFFALIFAVSLFLVSCDTENQTKTVVIDFEDITLTDSIWNGSDDSGSFSSLDFNFNNSYTRSDWGDYWSGFACSSKTDTETAGYMNQYSVIAGSGALNSSQFALAYDSASVIFPSDKMGEYEIKSAMLTNSTYTYLEILNGGMFTKKFAADDWFLVKFTGYLNDVEQSQVNYYLADFRDGKTFISNSWVEVDLSSLTNIDRISITFDSSDKGDFGVNTPKYVCIDNIEIEKNSELEVEN